MDFINAIILLLNYIFIPALTYGSQLALGALADYLLNFPNSEVNIVNDELNAALALWNFWKDDVLKCLKTATHGKRLASIGDYEDDFKCCYLKINNFIESEIYSKKNDYDLELIRKHVEKLTT